MKQQQQNNNKIKQLAKQQAKNQITREQEQNMKQAGAEQCLTQASNTFSLMLYFKVRKVL